jgi:hypothetical protein
MKNISAFQTSDGTLFTDKSAAEKHETFLAGRAEIEVFLESDINPYRAVAHRAIARNTVVNWTLWKNKHAK